MNNFYYFEYGNPEESKFNSEKILTFDKDTKPNTDATDGATSGIRIKILTEEDWFFKCHMQRELVMPGTLQIEAMLQPLVLTIYTMEGHKGKFSFISNINSKLISKMES